MPSGVYDRSGQAKAETEKVSNRAEETRRARRQRDDGDLDGLARLKLAIPREIKEIAKREGKTIHWFNDDGNRMHHMYNMDWDVIDHPLAQPVPVGISLDGKPIYARMSWKDQDYYEEDQEKKRKDLRARERAVERGKGEVASQDLDSSAISYTPQGNRISIGG